MGRITNPLVAIDGVGGPAGNLYGHPHTSTLVDVTYQCGGVLQPSNERCAEIISLTWAEIDADNRVRLEHEPAENLLLPPCPKCGGVTQWSLNDVEYGVEVPEHYTMAILRTHAEPRPKLKLKPYAASVVGGTHQGRDFSHLPETERPAHHQPVDVAAEIAARSTRLQITPRGAAEYPESV